MTDYFAGYPIASQTHNFLVTFAEGDFDAEASAQAIGQTCEADLVRLSDIFACNFVTGGANEYSTWVHVLAGTTGGASNYGWEQDQSSRIYVNGTTAPPTVSPYTQAQRDECARMLFVAELAEILMDFTGYGWNRRASNGEALSIVLATELHPIGYYQTGKGPRVNDWLLSNPRPDWITRTDSTDTNRVSYGCGVLFINWLRHQLSWPLTDIVTRPGCDTLAKTYHSLTGSPPEDAFEKFRTLIDAHLAEGAGGRVGRDDIFPLREGNARSVSLFFDSSSISQSRREPGIPVTLDPGFICEPRVYTYWLVDEVNEIDVTANMRGFASGIVRWAANGVPLSGGTGPVADTIALPATSSIRLPDGTQEIDAATSQQIQYTIGSSWNSGKLRIRNDWHIGNFPLEITATVTEKTPRSPDEGTSRTDDTIAYTLSIEMDPRWAEDRDRCNPEFHELDRSVLTLATKIYLLLHTPDPPPEAFVSLIALFERAQRASRQIGESAGLGPEDVLRDAMRAVDFDAIRLETMDGPLALRPVDVAGSDKERQIRSGPRPTRARCPGDLVGPFGGATLSTLSSP